MELSCDEEGEVAGDTKENPVENADKSAAAELNEIRVACGGDYLNGWCKMYTSIQHLSRLRQHPVFKGF